MADRYTYTTEQFSEGYVTTIWDCDALLFDLAGPLQEDRAQLIADALNKADMVDGLVAALADITNRFHACLVHNGTDPEFADEAVKDARAIVAKAESTQP